MSNLSKYLPPWKQRLLPASAPKGKKIGRGERIWISWPVALRRVRAWLEPYVMLLRYWRAWSEKAPPEPLQTLLDWLWIGRPLYLYCQ